MALTKGSKASFEWLRTKRAGDVVSRAELMDATGWSESSLKTYLAKNKLAPFILALADGQLRVLMDGTDLSEEYFDEVFTQTAPLKVNLAVGDKVVGEHMSYTLVEPLGQGAVGHVWSARPAPQAVGAGQYERPCETEEVCSLLRRMVSYAPNARPTLNEIGSVAHGIVR